MEVRAQQQSEPTNRNYGQQNQEQISLQQPSIVLVQGDKGFQSSALRGLVPIDYRLVMLPYRWDILKFWDSESYIHHPTDKGFRLRLWSTRKGGTKASRTEDNL